MIGRKFTDQSVQSDMKHWPFKVIDQEDKPKLQTQCLGEEKTFTPEQITSMMLTKMKESSEAYLGGQVRDAVITVPAFFDDSQRQATKEAGTLAGLNVLGISNEPTAAAIAYGFGKEYPEEEKNVLVFDVGGRACNVSVLLIEDGIFEVKHAATDAHLGGDDFDNRLASHLLAEFKGKFKEDVSVDRTAMSRLHTAAEKAKCTLSTYNQTDIEIDSLFEDVDFYATVSRATFEDLCCDLFQKCLQQVEYVLQATKLEKSRIDDVILVGGSTRIPKIKESLLKFFDGKELKQSINPEEVIAHGAAEFAVRLAETKDTPNVCTCCFAALSVGLEISNGVTGGIMTKLIKRNTQLPTRISRIFTTNFDKQTTISIHIYEGERAMTKGNHKLGFFELSGIPPAPRGVPKIQIIFDIDANDILVVTAQDQGTGVSSTITFTNYGSYERLSKEDIQRMVSDAEKHMAEDEAFRERITASGTPLLAIGGNIGTSLTSITDSEN